jgi:hypothetical protein
MKAFFGAYGRACVEADGLLLQAGDAAAIDLACQRSAIGKLFPTTCRAQERPGFPITAQGEGYTNVNLNIDRLCCP